VLSCCVQYSAQRCALRIGLTIPSVCVMWWSVGVVPGQPVRVLPDAPHVRRAAGATHHPRGHLGGHRYGSQSSLSLCVCVWGHALQPTSECRVVWRFTALTCHSIEVHPPVWCGYPRLIVPTVCVMCVCPPGSAAIYGLRGKQNVNCFILYPKGRTSAIQVPTNTHRICRHYR
jgi:hypothetical protein